MLWGSLLGIFDDKNQDRKEASESKSICKSDKNEYLYHEINKIEKENIEII